MTIICLFAKYYIILHIILTLILLKAIVVMGMCRVQILSSGSSCASE